ncbi:polynucleotide kinase-phosphatase [Chloroflexi bacterium TSY]|nr:polynucleotide kinase-phosphatase [Chloroflexi bacterium TSY]
MNITLPELSLVVLMDASGSGKSTFARTHFLPTEILSSDVCRGLVSDDDNNQAATQDAFDVLHYITAKRLARGHLTVIDATNVQPESRKALIRLAREYHVLPVAIVLNLPVGICRTRNQERPDRNFGLHVIRCQTSQLRRSLRSLKREGFRNITILDSEEAIASVQIIRQRLWNDKRDEHGPFDIIGDVHGCADELETLLNSLGYRWQSAPNLGQGRYPRIYFHPEGRKAFFLGDLVDRGPRILDTVQLVCHMVNQGSALCIPGNHDVKLVRKLRGRKVQIRHGLAETLHELDTLPHETRESVSNEIATFLDSLVSHYVLDNGKLVIAHAGLKESMQGRTSGKVREFALYGETTGETDEFGLPIRYNWASEYRGDAIVVYGHTPVPEAVWLNRTINVDTGAVFGGQLTALRYPELELVSVPSARAYADPIRPLNIDPSELTPQQVDDDILDIDDILGKQIISTRLRPNITIQAENSAAALEAMSRFAANPRWLIYLPPTMSPCAAVPKGSEQDEWLEYPSTAFEYYKERGVSDVICEEKHMGSRTVVVVCRNADVARRRFGVLNGSIGTCYTRTGRRFFDDDNLESTFLVQVQSALEQSRFWDKLNTNWVCLDCELMPWSAKAQGLLNHQYAAIGAAASGTMKAARAALKQAADNGVSIEHLQQQHQMRAEMINHYKAAYRPYCWPVHHISDLKLAPFHILATENAVHVDKNHLWHMETIAEFAEANSKDCLQSTIYRQVDLTKQESINHAINWWLDLTANGGEGMVVKPLNFIAKGRRGLIQPAVKCRGREYLRIIYGPEYTATAHLDQLRHRSMGRKRSLADREFALGVEALERFVTNEPLRRVHECVFGILALESEPVDPRL